MGKSKDCPAAQGGGAQGSAPAASAASEPGDPRPRRPQRYAASLGFSAPTREVRGTGRFPPDLLGLRLFRIAWSGGAGARNGHHLLTPEREEGPVGNAPGFGLQTAFANTRAHACAPQLHREVRETGPRRRRSSGKSLERSPQLLAALREPAL